MSMNKDQGRGRVKEARGKIKEVAGKLMGNKDLQAKGNAQEFSARLKPSLETSSKT